MVLLLFAFRSFKLLNGELVLSVLAPQGYETHHGKKGDTENSKQQANITFNNSQKTGHKKMEIHDVLLGALFLLEIKNFC